MERIGRSITAYNPQPAHLYAAEDPMTTNGIHTPSYGGTVSTGSEWEWVINTDGTKSRTPSRSPHRSAPEPHVHRSSSLSHTLESSSTASGQAYPSAQPHEPTIKEETSAYIGRSVSQSIAAQAKGPMITHGKPPAYPVHGAPTSPPAQSQSTFANPPSTSKKRQFRQVGDWQLQKTLGQGSMGKVKLGVNVITNERCAVKIVPRHREDPKPADPSGKSKDESKEIRTIREASISLLLHHPYICGMRDFIIHQNHFYMVFEYIDGGQMLDYIIAHGRLRERAARKFARQIGSALDYCHHNNIVHRDLKIENILISNNGNIKIIDFGLSNLYSPTRHLSTFCGSLYFAAPELLNAKLYTGPEVDIWSFGIVLYVLVCGKVPFDDQSMPALHAKIKRGLAEYPAWLSNDCKSLLQRMLNTNPLERATLVEVLSHPWMTKGFDGRPDSHLILREPLRADDLDLDVINRMQGFTFGSSEEIHENLQKILQSEAYFRCVTTWEAKRDRRRGMTGSNGSSAPVMYLVDGNNESPKKKRFSGFDLKKKLFKEEKKVEEPVHVTKEPLDPSSGFDPLISIYFLAREKKERAKVFGDGHFASSHASIDDSLRQGGYNMALPNLPAPPSIHGSGYDPHPIPGSPREPALSPQPRLRADELSNTVMQHPSVDNRRSNIADMPSAIHRRQPSLSQASPLPSAPMQSNARTDKGPSPSLPPIDSPIVDPRRSSTTQERKERRVSVGSISNTLGRASLSRRASQRSGSTKPITPPEPWSRQKDIAEQSSADARQVVSPESDETEPVDIANSDVKNIYLKGLFSVSTTSTKSAQVLQRDISNVLDRIGIKYRQIKGGFECMHVPSIDLASVVHGDEASSSLHVTPHRVLSPSSPSKAKSPRKPYPTVESVGSASTSRGESPSPGTRGHGHDEGSSGTVGVVEGNPPFSGRTKIEDDGDAWAHISGAGSGLCVRFEIFIVKVPWVPLHGIQFRRVGGDGWQYQQLAKTILREMRL